MLDQMFEGFRKASESSLKAHQDLSKQLGSFWPTAAPHATGVSTEGSEATRKRLRESAIDALNLHREFLDSAYKSGIQLLEQGLRVTSAKSPEDCSRLLGELSRKMSDTFKEQSAAQFRGFQKAAEWSEIQPKIKI